MNYQTKPKNNLQARDMVQQYFNLQPADFFFFPTVLRVMYYGIYSDGANVHINEGLNSELPHIAPDKFMQQIESRRWAEYELTKLPTYE